MSDIFHAAAVYRRATGAPRTVGCRTRMAEPATRAWSWPEPMPARLRGKSCTPTRRNAIVMSDPPTMPPELPRNPVSPEPPAHPVESPPSENPVPVREPSEVKPPVAVL